METWKCKVCGRGMSAQYATPTQLYCSPTCARKAHRLGDYNQADKRKRVMTIHDRLAVYLAYNQSCACCGFSLATGENEYAAVFKYAVPDALKVLPHEHAEHLKEQLKGASGGCEIHHINPIAEGGDNSSENLILLCPNCHKKVHAGVIPKEQLLASRVLLSDDVLLNACWEMIADIKDGNYQLPK